MNRLRFEKSPYLLQHASNPVDWYPWCEEAFERAKKEDKPIFLSIGYSTCHWCHVMARESFEDEEIAKLMNETFICIKVDREERPDIDSIYMDFCIKTIGHGGWPLNVIMTPDKKPFFVTTYIPKESKFGRIGMKELILKIREIWKSRRREIEEYGNNILKIIGERHSKAELDEETLYNAFRQISVYYDEDYGGFGLPKFPNAHVLMFLLRYWKRYKDNRALEIVLKTLMSMRYGGIYDQIGYGFHRYSVTKDWLLPHFEKMLYDQAMLAIAYIEAYQIMGNDVFKRTVEETLEYVIRCLKNEDAFYSAQNSESEGEEGKFYLWNEDEIRYVLGEDADFFIEIFGIERYGNYRDEVTGEKTGKNIPFLKNLNEVAKKLGLSEKELWERIEPMRRKLFEYREKRAHPEVDTKILADWNGLMSVAFAKAHVINPIYAEYAEKAINFILSKMYKDRLYHSYNSKIPAFLDDYAFVIWALIEIYEATFKTEYLKIAVELVNEAIRYFWDDEGGFYFTSDHEVVRKKEIADSSYPSGNSVMAYNLLRLYRITGNSDFEEKALKTLEFFSGSISRYPYFHAFSLIALDFAINPVYEIVIVDCGNLEFKKIKQRFIPNKVLLLKTSDLEEMVEFTKDMRCIDGKTTIYVCENRACKNPMTNLDDVLRILI